MNTQSDRYQLLGARLNMLSASGGYKASIDPVLLAASIPCKGEQRVLDVGCGVGAAALCLATRMPSIQVIGIDHQAPLVLLANKTAQLNRLKARTQFYACDLADSKRWLQFAVFDHVMANPPHLKKGSGNISPDPLKVAANVEGDTNLKQWVLFCVQHVVDFGTVTFVHRYDRKDELIFLLEEHGLVSVLPLWPKTHGVGAKRVLVQAVKGAVGNTRIKSGLVLHDADNTYTRDALAILREAEALRI